MKKRDRQKLDELVAAVEALTEAIRQDMLQRAQAPVTINIPARPPISPNTWTPSPFIQSPNVCLTAKSSNFLH